MRKVGLLLALAGLLAACDDDNPARHLDGGVSDSPQSDAPVVPQPVSVTVKFEGVAQAGVVVYFQNADSTLVATETTDATGAASHLLDAGGFVTAVDPFGNVPAPTLTIHHDVRTFAGVKPGDHLRIEGDYGEGVGVPMTMTLPPQTDSNIDYYAIQTSCGGDSALTVQGTGSSGSNPSGTVYFDRCTTADVLVTAYSAAGAQLGYFFVANQPVTMDGVIDYTDKTFAALSSRSYVLGNQPSNVTNFGIEQTIATTKGEVARYSSSASGMPATTTATLPNIPNTLSVVEVYGRTPNMFHYAYEWGPFSTNTYTTDYGARMLTDASAISFSATTHATTWTETSGVAPDFVAVSLSATRNTSTELHYVDWQIVAPHSGTSVALPTLPAGTFDLNIASTDSSYLNYFMLGKIDGGGYDAVRARFFAIDAVDHPVDIATGATGSAQLALKYFAQLARTTTPTPKKSVLLHRTQSTH